MPEMRRNPITKSWTIIATERAKRPELPTVERKITAEEVIYDCNCFFCPGNEHATPPEVLSFRDSNTMPNTQGWTLRVVRNKFAALNLDRDFHIKQENALQVSSHAAGIAEVLIESTCHSRNIALNSLDMVGNILKAYKERFIVLSQEKSIKYILIFRNNGIEAGASISHPHSQIIATPVIPITISDELTGANDYYESTGRCVYCDIAKNEMRDKSRIICENDDFISYAPYASKTPFETCIMPKFHSARYQDLKTEKFEH